MWVHVELISFEENTDVLISNFQLFVRGGSFRHLFLWLFALTTGLVSAESVDEKVIVHSVLSRYDAYKSLLYLTAHLAHNYSVLLQCFTEVSEGLP